MTDNLWGYQPAAGHTVGTDLIGYKVEATDGSIGKVDKHSDDVTSSYLVVDTGVWIFGKHVLLPAGTVSRVDNDEKKVFVEGTTHRVSCPAPTPWAVTSRGVGRDGAWWVSGRGPALMDAALETPRGGSLPTAPTRRLQRPTADVRGPDTVSLPRTADPDHMRSDACRSFGHPDDGRVLSLRWSSAYHRGRGP